VAVRDLRRPAVLGEIAVVVGCLAGLVWVGFKVVEPRRSEAATLGDAPVIAKVEKATDGVRRRPNQTLVWYDLTTGESLQRRDMVFVGPEASAVVVFEDGTRLDIDSDSLIVIEGGSAAGDDGDSGAKPVAQNVNVRVGRGVVVATAGSSGKVTVTSGGATTGATSKTAGGDLSLETGGKVAVEVRDGSANVEVLEGTAVVETIRGKQELRVKQALGIAEGAVGAVESRTVALTSPARGRRVWFHPGKRRATLRWKGAVMGAQVEVSQSATFASGVTRAPADKGVYRFKASAAGTWYWRVVDTMGKPVSPRRRFVLEEDAPAKLLKPVPDEAVVAKPGEDIDFKWAPVKGVDTFVLEISSDDEFEEPEFTKTLDDEQFKYPSTLKEGRYHWRVRSLDKSRGKSPWSKIRVFRLLHTPLLSAPKAVDVKLEVEDGK